MAQQIDQQFAQVIDDELTLCTQMLEKVLKRRGALQQARLRLRTGVARPILEAELEQAGVSLLWDRFQRCDRCENLLRECRC